MKKLLTLMVAVVALVACSNEDEEENSVSVRFRVTANDWSVVTRALTADGQDMTDLWIFDYMGGTLVGTTHKTSADADFDAPTLTMKNGAHTVYFVASRGKTPTVSGTKITWQQPSDTFWKTVAVDVAPGDNETVSVVLDRVVTRLRVSIADEIPTSAAQLVMTPGSWWYGINYLTGAAVDEQQNERAVSIPASFVGTTSLVASIFGFSDGDEWVTDVTITAKDGDGNSMGTVTLADVPFVKNRTTEVSGSLFGGDTPFAISLNGEWLTPHTVEW